MVKGQLSFQDKKDFIDYNFLKKKKNIDFRTNFKIDENPIHIDFLNYKKDPNLKAEIILKGSHTIDKKTIIDSFIYSEKKNKFKIDHIVLNKNLKINRINEKN